MSSKMVVNQPQPVMYAQESDEWSSGICDCCDDVPDCCFAFWCLPCFACITSRNYGEHLCLPLLEMFSGMIPAITMSMRVSMRHRYGIRHLLGLNVWRGKSKEKSHDPSKQLDDEVCRGTMCRDCALSTFCVPCSWCQMSREMKRRKIPIVMVAAKNT